MQNSRLWIQNGGHEIKKLVPKNVYPKFSFIIPKHRRKINFNNFDCKVRKATFSFFL